MEAKINQMIERDMQAHKEYETMKAKITSPYGKSPDNWEHNRRKRKR
jgi:hypothetical protein